MRKLRTLLTYISSNRIWLVTLACLELFFVFLAWFAYPENFLSLVGLMIFVSLAALILPLVISIYKRKNRHRLSMFPVRAGRQERIPVMRKCPRVITPVSP